MPKGYGWAGTVGEFLSTPIERWERSLAYHHSALLGLSPAGTQIQAWREEHEAMTLAMLACIEAKPHDATRWSEHGNGTESAHRERSSAKQRGQLASPGACPPRPAPWKELFRSPGIQRRAGKWLG